MRKIFYFLIILFVIFLVGLFLDNYVFYGFIGVIISTIISPGNVTAQELAIEKMWGKDFFYWSIVGPRQAHTEEYIIAGTIKNDASVCPNYDDFENSRCKYEVAINLADKSLCKEFRSDFELFDSETCVATVDGIVKKDPKECDKLGQIDRDRCYQDLARVLKDQSICEKLSNSKHRCYWNLAVSMEREDLCELAPFTQACIAIAKRDSSLCNDIWEKIERSKCYYNIAILTGEPTTCEAIKEKESVKFCTYLAKECAGRDCTFLAQRYT